MILTIQYFPSQDSDVSVPSIHDLAAESGDRIPAYIIRLGERCGLCNKIINIDYFSVQMT